MCNFQLPFGYHVSIVVPDMRSGQGVRFGSWKAGVFRMAMAFSGSTVSDTYH